MRSGVEHVGRQVGLGARQPEVLGTAVGHREQPADPARDRVLRHRRVGQLARAPPATPACAPASACPPCAGARARPRPGSPARARPVPRRRRPPAPSAGGWRRRSWRGGSRSPAPRGASAAPPRPARRRVRRAGSASPRSRRRPGSPRGRHHAPRAPSPRCPDAERRPTRASAASGPGHVTSRADERPGSVRDPWARNAPRHAASASHTDAETTCGGRPRTGRPRPSSRPGLARERLAVLDDAHHVPRAAAQAPRRDHQDLARVAEDLRDVLAQPPGRHRRVELGLDDDATRDDVQATGEAEHRRDLCLAAAGLGDAQPAQLVLDLCRQCHAGHPATVLCRARPRGPPPSIPVPPGGGLVDVTVAAVEHVAQGGGET